MRLVLWWLHWKLCGNHTSPLARLLDSQKYYRTNYGGTQVQSFPILSPSFKPGLIQVVELCQWWGCQCLGVREGGRWSGLEAEQSWGPNILDRPGGKSCYLGEDQFLIHLDHTCAGISQLCSSLTTRISGIFIFYRPLSTGAPMGSSCNHRSQSLRQDFHHNQDVFWA